jgi:hypothetical protein
MSDTTPVLDLNRRWVNQQNTDGASSWKKTEVRCHTLTDFKDVINIIVFVVPV